MIEKLVPYIRRYAPFALLIVVGIIFIAMGGKKYIDFNEFVKAQEDITMQVNLHPVSSTLLFIGVYISVVISLLPGLSALDLFSGFIFPQPVSFLIVMFSSWVGACLLFLASRHAFSNLLKDKGGKWVDRIHKGFDKYQSGYLVFLRVFPFFPFSVISVALGFTRVTFFKYAWTTALGSIPSLYIFTMAGSHIGAAITGGVSKGELLTPKIFIIYLFFICAVLLPLFLKKRKVEKCEEDGNCD